MKIGDKVAYSVKFLKSIGCYTGNMPSSRGIITDIIKVGDRQLAAIKWNNPGTPKKVLTANLVLIEKIGIESTLNT